MDASRPFEIRAERAGDVPAVRRVVEAAFKGKAEAELVDALRAGGKFSVALVASQRRTVAGFVLLTDVEIVGNGLKPSGAGLAPLAVRPTFQRRGTAACSCAPRRARTLLRLLVLPATRRITSAAPHRRDARARVRVRSEEAFMIELAPGALAGVTGTVRYLPEFAESFA
jgi:predicted N-acetyltransferase YhbS